MQLDLPTLYIVILLNSLSLAVVWAAVAAVYRSFVAARYWLASLLMTSFGGILLAMDGSAAPAAPTFAGIALIGAGFGVMWQGVRVFYGKKPLWRALGVLVALSVVSILAVDNDRAQQNVVYATVQVIPIALAAITLSLSRPRKLGALVAACAAALALVGHAGEISTNLSRLAGLMSTDQYHDVAAWFLVAVIIGGSIWNLGFLLMAIDRLRADLAALATSDDLTGLPNRRGFREQAQLRETSEQGKRPGAVMMIDLDHFKMINDRYGHAVGDACLVHVASVINGMRRPHDVLARLSGDEFCLLLPDTDMREAAGVAARLTKVVAATPFQWKGRGIPLSISIGLTAWAPLSGQNIGDALDVADAALYETKRAGRNGYRVGVGDASVVNHSARLTRAS